MSADNDDIILDIDLHKHDHLSGTVHNYFIDHIDHSDESEYHHHHSPEGGIVHHKHPHNLSDNDDGHGHHLKRYYANNLVGSEHYASNNHDHPNVNPDNPPRSDHFALRDTTDNLFDNAPAIDTSPPPYFDYPSDP